MSLLTCPDCGRSVSNQAPACPGCGRPFRSQRPTAERKGIGCGGGLLILLGIGFLASRIIVFTSSSGERPAAPVPTKAATAKPAQKSLAYDAGYKRAYPLGLDHAKRGYGMPNDLGMRLMSDNHCPAIGFSGSAECTRGFAAGFEAGFRTKKPSGRNAEDYEALSWENAIPGTKLYDFNGEWEVTIVGADEASGAITVRYRRSGDVEPKLLSAVSRSWYVKKVRS